MSEFSDMSGNPVDEDVEEGNDEDYDVIYSEITPYQDEPLAQVDAGDENTGEEIKVDEELDEDGLTPTGLTMFKSESCIKTKTFLATISATAIAEKVVKQ